MKTEMQGFYQVNQSDPFITHYYLYMVKAKRYVYFKVDPLGTVLYSDKHEDPGGANYKILTGDSMGKFERIAPEAIMRMAGFIS